MYTEAKYNKAEEFLDKIAEDGGKEKQEKLVKSKQRVKDAGEVFTLVG